MKNIKHSEQNIKVEITKKVAKLGSQTRLVKIWRKVSKGAGKRFRQSFVCIY